MHKKNGVDFCNIQAARMIVMGALSAASMESYERSYPMLLRLHALHEIEQAFSILCPDQVLSDYTFQSTDSKKGKLQAQQLSGPAHHRFRIQISWLCFKVGVERETRSHSAFGKAARAVVRHATSGLPNEPTLA